MHPAAQMNASSSEFNPNPNAADAGVVTAQFGLCCLYVGLAVTLNLLALALPSNPTSNPLLLVPTEGWGVSKDHALAREWLGKAAQNGHGEAGELYRMGF